MSIRWHISALLAKNAIRLLKATGWYDGYWNHWRGKIFNDAQRRGLHIVPVHFYTPIPDTSRLSAELWFGKSALPGITLDLDRAAALLAAVTADYRPEFEHFPKEKTADPHQFYLANSAYSTGDAEVLYSMVRHYKPKRIIEIGAGYTSLVIAQAIRENTHAAPERPCDFLSIEPFPPAYLDPRPPGLTRMLVQELQRVPLEEFETLGDGDFLFIDSSHVAKTGSDVVYEYLEIVPRLNPGVFVHVHDIFLPYEYPREWLETARFFWNEQYVLQALLQSNPHFEILLPLHALYRERHDAFIAQVPSSRQSTSRPSAFWLRRI